MTGFGEHNEAWPDEIKEAVQEYDCICCWIENLTERLKRADENNEVDHLIQDLLFFKEQRRKLGRRIGLMILGWRYSQVNHKTS